MSAALHPPPAPYGSGVARSSAKVITPPPMVQVSMADFRRKLGPVAWRLCAYLALLRNQAGYVRRQTNESLSAALGCSEKAIERASARLRAAGVLLSKQNDPRALFHGDRVVYARRRLLGEFPQGLFDAFVMVPQQTAAWVKTVGQRGGFRTACTGGARPGAGRPRGSVETEPRKIKRLQNHQTGVPLIIKPGCRPPQNHQTGEPSSLLLSSLSLLGKARPPVGSGDPRSTSDLFSSFEREKPKQSQPPTRQYRPLSEIPKGGHICDRVCRESGHLLPYDRQDLRC